MATIKDMLFASKSGGGGGQSADLRTFSTTITDRLPIDIEPPIDEETGRPKYDGWNRISLEVDIPSDIFDVVITGVNTRTQSGEEIYDNMYTCFGVGLFAGNTMVGLVNTYRNPGSGRTVTTSGGFFVDGYTLSDITGAKPTWWETFFPDDTAAYYTVDHVDTSNNAIYLDLHMTYS